MIALAHQEECRLMRKQSLKGTRWAAYQNKALDSALMGRLQYLAVGEEHTYKEPPGRYPIDGEMGMGWRYLFIGYVNLHTGEINKEEGGDD